MQGEHLDAEWKRIQKYTFTRWCNEQLRQTGKQVVDLGTDFEDGLILIVLMEQLTKQTMQSRYNKNPRIVAQKKENIQLALDMIKREGIRLVNLGCDDILGGNLKLILGLIWTLILHYQIKRSTKQSKLWSKGSMRDWMDAVVTHKSMTNFSSNWNDGIALSALINYCDPTLMSDFKSLAPANAHDNCMRAMHLAKEKFEIPMIVSPEDMCNPHIDELSGMTYLSYFARNEGPGWYATLNWVRKKVPELNVHNFQSDWNDGRVLCALAEAVAEGACPEWKELSKDDKLANCQKGIDAGRKLGMKHDLSALDFTSPNVDELQVMTYAVRMQHLMSSPN